MDGGCLADPLFGDAMTLEEAKSLVLREGISDNGNAPEDAVFIMLHIGYQLDHDQVRRLIEAVDTIHEAIERDTVLDRRLAGAMWTLGVEASSAMNRDLSPAELDDITGLFYAIESAIHNYWSIGDPRDKADAGRLSIRDAAGGGRHGFAAGGAGGRLDSQCPPQLMTP